MSKYNRKPYQPFIIVDPQGSDLLGTHFDLIISMLEEAAEEDEEFDNILSYVSAAKTMYKDLNKK